MTAEAVDWEDSATVSGKPVALDEAWHVAIAPDEVKVVSLEQLDDMFRLSLVDAETRVWQPGMSEWVTLGEVAGLDEEPPAPPKRAPPKPPAPRSAPPPQRLAPPAPRPIAPRTSAPPASFYAKPLEPVNYAAPVKPPPSFAPTPMTSVRPLVVSRNPYPMPQKGGSFGRFIVAAALLSGICVSLYRNDVLRDAARSIHREDLYAVLEQKLGGPSFGTMRSVEQSTANMSAASLTLTNLSSTSPQRAPETASTSGALANDVPAPTPNHSNAALIATGSAPPVVSLESLGTEKSGKTEAKAAVLPMSAGKTARAKPEIAKAEQPEPKSVKAEKPAPPPPSAVPDKPESEMSPREKLNAAIAKSMTGSASKKNKLKAGGSDYDPLNPKL